MDKDKELPVVVRLCCGGLAGGISQTGKSGIIVMPHFHEKKSCDWIGKSGSMYVSGRLPTYPSPNLKFYPKQEVSVNVRFKEG